VSDGSSMHYWQKCSGEGSVERKEEQVFDKKMNARPQRGLKPAKPTTS